jgi:hypothetical protein
VNEGRRVRLTAEQVAERLREQLANLDHYCAAFDAGTESMAMPMSVAIRVLAYDAGKSVSLFTQLGIKDTLRVIDWRGPEDPEPLAYVSDAGLARLAHYSDGRPSKYVPLDAVEKTPPDTASWMPVEAWWKDQIVLRAAGLELRRRNLVLLIANRAGGAHLDPSMPSEEYGLHMAGGMG